MIQCCGKCFTRACATEITGHRQVRLQESVAADDGDDDNGGIGDDDGHPPNQYTAS